jgi:type II secretory pathway component PulF
MNGSGAVVADVIDCDTREDAVAELRDRGLMLVKLVAQAEEALATPKFTLKNKVTNGDLVLFARQMKMLLTSGASLVPALEAAEQQSERPPVRAMVAELREHVENGGTLTEAMEQRPDVFKPVHCSMVAAGEATAMLPDAFERLAALTARQQQTRRAIVSALIYPAVLSLLCTGVVGLLLFFVVPRFKTLFADLNSSLPMSTQMMFATAEGLRTYWPILVGVLVAVVVGIVAALRTDQIRQEIARQSLQIPVIGKVVGKLELAKVLRVWAAMLRSNVPLLETIAQSRAAVSNPVFVELLTRLEENVSGGGRIGQTLADSPYIERIAASAITTGEENGRLAESVDFVSGWIDDENTQVITGLTRMAEPVLLAFMGAVVGLVALSLFLPLFDIAAAG